MTVATARALLRPPLTFGDPEQIRARNLVRQVEDCKEAIRGCECRHLRELARLGPGQAAVEHWARRLRMCDCVFEGKLDFTVRTGTIFERSHVPLHKWLYAMYLLVTARKGISSMQLAKEIGITQKSAWFVLHRLREACGKDLDKLRGTVEIDETFIGGLEINKHEADKQNLGRGSVGKIPVLGMRERGGRTKAMPLKTVSMEEIQNAIHRNIEVGSTLFTDEHGAYNDLDGLFFRQERVNHSAGEYVRGIASTNSIESVWAVLKRGLHGVYHQVSKKHLARYVDEFTFRLNQGNVARHTLKRLDSFVDAVAGKRLTYERLTA